MDTKGLRDILEKLDATDAGEGNIGQAIKEIQELYEPMSEEEIESRILMNSCPAYSQNDYEYQYGVTDKKYRIVEVKKIAEVLVGKLSTPRLSEPHIVDSVVVFDTAYSAEDIKRLLNELMIYKRDKPRLMEECPECKGTGQKGLGIDWKHTAQECPKCNGTGKKPSVREERGK